MPFPLDYYIDQVVTEYNAAYGDGGSCAVNMKTAGQALEGGDTYSAGIALQIAGDRMADFTEECLTRYTHQHYRITNALYWINNNWPEDGEEYELTMSKILDAMWDATDLQPLLFIVLIDAMRASLVERTVDLPTIERYVRHFML